MKLEQEFLQSEQLLSQDELLAKELHGLLTNDEISGKIKLSRAKNLISQLSTTDILLGDDSSDNLLSYMLEILKGKSRNIGKLKDATEQEIVEQIQIIALLLTKSSTLNFSNKECDFYDYIFTKESEIKINQIVSFVASEQLVEQQIIAAIFQNEQFDIFGAILKNNSQDAFFTKRLAGYFREFGNQTAFDCYYEFAKKQDPKLDKYKFILSLAINPLGAFLEQAIRYDNRWIIEANIKYINIEAEQWQYKEHNPNLYKFHFKLIYDQVTSNTTLAAQAPEYSPGPNVAEYAMKLKKQYDPYNYQYWLEKYLTLCLKSHRTKAAAIDLILTEAKPYNEQWLLDALLWDDRTEDEQAIKRSYYDIIFHKHFNLVKITTNSFSKFLANNEYELFIRLIDAKSDYLTDSLYELIVQTALPKYLQGNNKTLNELFDKIYKLKPELLNEKLFNDIEQDGGQSYKRLKLEKTDYYRIWGQMVKKHPKHSTNRNKIIKNFLLFSNFTKKDFELYYMYHLDKGFNNQDYSDWYLDNFFLLDPKLQNRILNEEQDQNRGNLYKKIADSINSSTTTWGKFKKDVVEASTLILGFWAFIIGGFFILAFLSESAELWQLLISNFQTTLLCIGIFSAAVAAILVVTLVCVLANSIIEAPKNYDEHVKSLDAKKDLEFFLTLNQVETERAEERKKQTPIKEPVNELSPSGRVTEPQLGIFESIKQKFSQILGIA